MIEQLKGRSSALLVASLAVVAAVAGTAIASDPIATSSKAVTKKKVKKIADKQINKQLPWETGDLADGAVTEPKIADGAVTEPKIADGLLQPAAFGQVNANGTIVSANTEGFTAANVSVLNAGTLYCFRNLGFTPKVILANVVWQSGGNTDVRTATVPPDALGGCPAGTTASARTTTAARLTATFSSACRRTTST